MIDLKKIILARLMDNDDLLQNNRFISDITENAGYGMTDQLRRFKLRQQVEAQYITLDDDRAEQELLDSDLLKTNPVLTEDGAAKTLDIGRRVSESRTILNINSVQRDIYNYTTKVARNPETGLYTREVEDDEGTIHVQLYNVDILNNEYVPGVTNGVPDIPRPYFLRPDGDIGVKTYRYASPNDYIVTLPHKFINVKSVRLLGAEVPNSLDSINQYNNLILLDIKDNDTGDSIPLKTGASPYNFILFQLVPGNYTLTELAAHIQDKVNTIVEDYSVDGFTDLFTVSINEQSGEFTITLNDPPGRDLEFHWRFWFVDETNSTLPITRETNLWFMLGYPHPYEINQDGTDKYTKEFTNLFDFGMNPLIDGEVPDREEFHVIAPFRYPDVYPHKYIYLEITGLGCISDLQNPTVTRFNGADIFAKIILDVPPGATARHFQGGVTLFPATLPLLEKLHIKWVDAAGLPVNFQFRNQSFALEIIEYIDELDTVAYNSRRGTIDKSSYPDIIKYGGH